MEKDSLRDLIKTMIMENVADGDFTNMTFDAEEVANFVTEYIKRNQVSAVPVTDRMVDYYLSMEAKNDFDEIGFSSYRIEPSSMTDGYVVVKWPKVD